MANQKDLQMGTIQIILLKKALKHIIAWKDVRIYSQCTYSGTYKSIAFCKSKGENMVPSHSIYLFGKVRESELYSVDSYYLGLNISLIPKPVCDHYLLHNFLITPAFHVFFYRTAFSRVYKLNRMINSVWAMENLNVLSDNAVLYTHSSLFQSKKLVHSILPQQAWL